MAKLLLETTGLTQDFGQRRILDTGPLRIFAGDRIGIVGANGAGKSTLLNLLSGRLSPETGTVTRRCAVAYLEQFGSAASPAEGKLLREFGMADRPDREGLSGGEEMRLRLTAVMGEGALLTFADEPTSNLDEAGIRLVCEKLAACGTFLLISHDRAVLDRLCTCIWEVESGRVTAYPGNYSAYREQKALERRRQQGEYDRYREEKSRLEAALADRDRQSRKVRKAPSRMGNSEARLHKREATEKEEKLHSARKALESRLARLEVKEPPRDPAAARIDFSLTDPPANKIVLRGERLTFGYGDRLLFRDASFELPRGSKTVLWGENGCGKTTLLRLIAQNGEGITRVPKVRIGWFCQDLRQLDPEKTVLENALADAVQPEPVMRSVLARLLLRREDVDKKAGVLSGGERVKLAFAKLFGSPANLLLLDEPTNYLDLPAIEALQEMLREYPGTVLFVTHDRAFADCCAGRTLTFSAGKLLASQGGPSALDAERSSPPPSMSRAVLELRLAQVIARLSDPSCPDKETLEARFQELLRQKNALSD